MSSRKLRRAEAHKARKLARKAGFPNVAVVAPSSQQQPSSQETSMPEQPLQPPQQEDQPAVATSSERRSEASRENGRLSHGPLTPATKAISALNHTTHGLARHSNGVFKLLASESAQTFEAFKQSLLDEHQAATPTELILVNNMIESEWLAQRARRLQDTCLDPVTGEIKDEKKFTLYMRYQTTHTRAFHKCLNHLAKLRKEKRQAALGFEAEKRANDARTMKKLKDQVTLFQKDVVGQMNLAKLTAELLKADKEKPGFPEKFNAELEKRGLDKEWWAAAYA